MKTILTTLILLSVSLFNSSYAGGTIKEVCKDKTDKNGKVILNADGSSQKTCKKIKVHQKVEGDKIPSK